MMNQFSNSDVEGSANQFWPDEYWREQCMLYLLDELDEQGTSEFVQQLEDSAELNQYLSEQADVIAQLSINPSATKRLVPRSTAQPRWNGMVVALVAIAAAALAIFSVQRHGNDNPKQATIALAWADSQSLAAVVSPQNSADELLDEIELNFVTSQTDSQIDETLDWMYTALSIEVGTDLEKSNDG